MLSIVVTAITNPYLHIGEEQDAICITRLQQDCVVELLFTSNERKQKFVSPMDMVHNFVFMRCSVNVTSMPFFNAYQIHPCYNRLVHQRHKNFSTHIFVTYHLKKVKCAKFNLHKPADQFVKSTKARDWLNLQRLFYTK